MVPGSKQLQSLLLVVLLMLLLLCCKLLDLCLTEQ